MIWATRELDSLPLHDLNEALDDLEANVPSDAIPTLRNAARILYVTNWDATLKADADAIHEHAVATIGAAPATHRYDAARREIRIPVTAAEGANVILNLTLASPLE